MNKSEKKTLHRIRQYIQDLSPVLDAYQLLDGMSEISRAEILSEELEQKKSSYIRTLVLLDELLYNYGQSVIKI